MPNIKKQKKFIGLLEKYIQSSNKKSFEALRAFLRKTDFNDLDLNNALGAEPEQGHTPLYLICHAYSEFDSDVYFILLEVLSQLKMHTQCRSPQVTQPSPVLLFDTTTQYPDTQGFTPLYWLCKALMHTIPGEAVRHEICFVLEDFPEHLSAQAFNIAPINGDTPLYWLARAAAGSPQQNTPLNFLLDKTEWHPFLNFNLPESKSHLTVASPLLVLCEALSEKGLQMMYLFLRLLESPDILQNLDFNEFSYTLSGDAATPLFFICKAAFEGKRQPLMKLLDNPDIARKLNFNVEVDDRGYKGKTPLDWLCLAALDGRPEMLLKVLKIQNISFPLDFNKSVPDRHRNPLFLLCMAAFWGHAGPLEALLNDRDIASDLNFNLPVILGSHKGETPLLWLCLAAANGQTQWLMHCLENPEIANTLFFNRALSTFEVPSKPPLYWVAVAAFNGDSDPLLRILENPTIASRLHFNQPYDKEHRAGETALFKICQAAYNGHPVGFYKLLQMPTIRATLDFNHAEQNDFEKGRPPLYWLCKAAAKGRPEPLLALLDNPECARTLNFNLPFEPDTHQGESPLYWVCEAAIRGYPSALHKILHCTQLDIPLNFQRLPARMQADLLDNFLIPQSLIPRPEPIRFAAHETSLSHYIADLQSVPEEKSNVHRFNALPKKARKSVLRYHSELTDSLTGELPNIPVILHEQLFDWSTLEPILQHERPINPINGAPFSRKHVHPAKGDQALIEKVLNNTESHCLSVSMRRLKMA